MPSLLTEVTISAQGDIMHFLQEHLWPRNIWIQDDRIEIYFRRTTRRNPESALELPAKTVDVATVNVQEKLCHKGVFTVYLAYIEETSKKLGYEMVFIENIFAEFLPPALERRGYKKYFMSTVDPDGVPCMYKLL